MGYIIRSASVIICFDMISYNNSINRSLVSIIVGGDDCVTVVVGGVMVAVVGDGGST